MVWSHKLKIVCIYVIPFCDIVEGRFDCFYSIFTKYKILKKFADSKNNRFKVPSREKV